VFQDFLVHHVIQVLLSVQQVLMAQLAQQVQTVLFVLAVLEVQSLHVDLFHLLAQRVQTVQALLWDLRVLVVLMGLAHHAVLGFQQVLGGLVHLSVQVNHHDLGNLEFLLLPLGLQTLFDPLVPEVQQGLVHPVLQVFLVFLLCPVHLGFLVLLFVPLVRQALFLL
jgi:hypothetical protein